MARALLPSPRPGCVQARRARRREMAVTRAASPPCSRNARPNSLMQRQQPCWHSTGCCSLQSGRHSAACCGLQGNNTRRQQQEDSQQWSAAAPPHMWWPMHTAECGNHRAACSVTAVAPLPRRRAGRGPPCLMPLLLGAIMCSMVVLNTQQFVAAQQPGASIGSSSADALREFERWFEGRGGRWSPNVRIDERRGPCDEANSEGRAEYRVVTIGSIQPESVRHLLGACFARIQCPSAATLYNLLTAGKAGS